MIVVVPVETGYPIHDPQMPETTWRALNDGSLGYQKWKEVLTESPLSVRAITWVNPHVKIFVRADLLPRAESIR